MSDSAEPVDLGDPTELIARAHDTRAVVVGGGVSGLVAALELAKVGMRVTVLEASAELGGAIRTREVGGLRLDVGAESFALRGGAVAALVEELGLDGLVVAPAGGGAWIGGLPGGAAAPIPTGGVLGIPENPFAPAVRRIIGTRGAWRAYVDRMRPPLTIGHEHSLGSLVRRRMGERVLDRLVAPVVTGVYSARPDDIDVDVAAPGLNAALTRAGSLSGAVAELRGDRPAGARPGAAVNGLRGGMGQIIDALARRLGELDARLVVDAHVASIARRDGGFTVTAEVAPEAPESPESPAAETPATDASAPESVALEADLVIVASDERTARRLLPGVLPPLESELVEPRVEVVTLVVDTPALDAAPRGTGVLTVPGSHIAKALTHATVKWPWLAEAAGADRHVVRVSFGAQGEAPATAGMSDADATALAVREASALLGVEIAPDAVVDAHIARYAQSQPASIIGHAQRTTAAREAVRREPGLGVAGAWLAGTGLAQVVPDAREEADRVRRAALWAPEA